MNQADAVSAATVISLNFRSRDPVDEKTTGVITVVIQQPESALNHFVVNKTSDGFLVCWTVVVYVHARIDEAVELAKIYGSKDTSYGFVNGILAKII